MATYNGMTRAKSHFHIARWHATGASATTGFTVTGIKTTSTILWIDHISTAASVATIASIDLDEASISAANEVTLASTDTSSDQVMVVWTDNDG